MERSKGGSSLDACGKFVKYSIFTVNFLLFLGGLVVIALGIWVLVTISPTQKALDSDKGIVAAAILLAFGGILAFITFLGCCGAIKEVKCLLLTFFIFVLVIAILFIVSAVLLYKYSFQVEGVFVQMMSTTLHDYGKDKESKEAWDYMQINWKCCGVKNYTDWHPTVPSSCNCASNCDGNPYWILGCESYLSEKLQSLVKPILAVVITIIVVLLLSLVFTCSLVLML